MTEAKSKLVKRKIIEIDEELCTGCGNCIITCAEGALEIIDGKAKVIKDVLCDGLGACIGECPEGALKIIEREALEFDEEEVEKHLETQKIRKEEEHLEKTLKHTTLGKPIGTANSQPSQCGCPSAKMMVFKEEWTNTDVTSEIPSALRQWPTKLKLVSPSAPYFNNKELVIVSDCSPLAYGDFHRKILKGKPIITLCPMFSLDDPDLEKLSQIIEQNPIETVSMVLMEVPCCQKIKLFIEPIIENIDRPIEVREIIIGRSGQILREGKVKSIFK